MNFDTPLVEYLIIGMHTASWIAIIILKVFKIPLNALHNLDATTGLLLLPFVYILGMMVDDLVFNAFKKGTEKIKDEVLYGKKNASDLNNESSHALKEKKKDPKFMDENIALRSPDLYNAYEARVRRIKIIAAAFFNWPLLGLALCIYFGTQNKWLLVIIATLSIGLMLISYQIWNNLTRRAYSFRKKAGAVIASQEK